MTREQFWSLVQVVVLATAVSSYVFMITHSVNFVEGEVRIEHQH